MCFPETEKIAQLEQSSSTVSMPTVLTGLTVPSLGCCPPSSLTQALTTKASLQHPLKDLAPSAGRPTPSPTLSKAPNLSAPPTTHPSSILSSRVQGPPPHVRSRGLPCTRYTEGGVGDTTYNAPHNVVSR